ncbi:MAG TPA: GAF domain-containing protein [Levilinea sp.]|nr:GAF domain-containing protein [Levilinea sp.]
MVTLTYEQLEERLAALHRASLELVGDISLESLLHRIAVMACEQVSARYAAVGILGESSQLEQFITVGMSEHEVQQMEHPPLGLGLIGALMQSETAIRIPDIAADPRSVGFPKHHPVMISFLGVPIRSGNRQLGQIYLTNKLDGSQFTDDDQLVIETLASYAAVGVTNARLYKQLIRRDHVLTRRNENLALLNELASTLASSFDIDAILDKSLSQVMDYLSLEVCEVYLRQGDARNLVRVHHRSKSLTGLWDQTEFRFGEGMVGMTAESGQANQLTLTGENGFDLSQSVLDSEFNRIACFPLNGRQGVLGVFCVATRPSQPLGELEMQFLTAISSWIGTSVENVRLNIQQRRLVVLEERERIGMDLHDGVIQSIYAVGLTLEHARLLMNEDATRAMQRIEQAIADLNSTIRDIRAYILDLRPRQLHNEDLARGVQRLMSEFRANTLVEVTLRVPADGLAGLPDAQAIALFHICQEALANIAKHARAQHVNITLWATAGRALLEVQDDGLGFEAEKVRLTLGHGLSNMQTRARNAGGDVDFTSEPGHGTTVFAWVPFSTESFPV